MSSSFTRRFVQASAIAAACLATIPACAGQVEVLHWWTSGGESKSVEELKRLLAAQGHTWRDFADYRKEYDHWLWRKVGDDAANNGGHGGMDYVLQWRTVQLMRAGLVPDIDVYDSAAWCSAVPLSAASLARQGRPVEIPDFTRGAWAGKRPGLDSSPTDMPPVR